MRSPLKSPAFGSVAVGHLAEIQLGKMLQPAPVEPGDVETTYLKAGHLAGLASIAELPTMFASTTDRTTYEIRLGDLLVVEGGDAGRTGFAPEVPYATIIQNSLHRIRSRRTDLRFLKYALDAVYASGWIDVVCNKSTFGHLTREKLSSLRVPAPDLNMQRDIADFLDAQTARIDALIEKKVRVMEVLAERKSLLFVHALASRGLRWATSLEAPAADGDVPSGWTIAHLSTVLEQLTNGYVGPTRDMLVEEGVRYIQSLHIKDGEIDFDRRPYYVPREWHDLRPRIHLRPGDVLIVQTGDIGQVAVVPNDFGPASCHALQIARVRKDVLTGEYLGEYLRSPFGRQSLLRRVTGALHPHLEGGIRDVPVIVPPLPVQVQVIDELRERAPSLDRLGVRLARQMELLRERRQALVTAAVTGQLDVAKAAA